MVFRQKHKAHHSKPGQFLLSLALSTYQPYIVITPMFIFFKKERNADLFTCKKKQSYELEFQPTKSLFILTLKTSEIHFRFHNTSHKMKSIRHYV